MQLFCSSAWPLGSATFRFLLRGAGAPCAPTPPPWAGMFGLALGVFFLCATSVRFFLVRGMARTSRSDLSPWETMLAQGEFAASFHRAFEPLRKVVDKTYSLG